MSEKEIKTGERYAKSPLTGNWYLVTKWEERPDLEKGRIVARQKEEVDESEVPEEYIE